MPGLWIIAPVYNEEKSLGAFVREWMIVLRKIVGGDFIFCLLNDGSRDESLKILTLLEEKYPELRVIDKTNTGHGPTCLKGYNLAIEGGADWVLQIDADGQCDPSHFDDFWKSRSQGPVHYGVRHKREDGWSRRLISKMLAVFLFLLTGRWIRDPHVPYRLMRREALAPALKQIPPDFRVANVLLALIHYENPGIQWHRIGFRKRVGRQNPVRLSFFAREAIIFLRDYISYVWHGDVGNYGEIILKVGRFLLGVSAIYYLLAFPILAWLRAYTLVEYDWIEGFHLTQVHQFLEGTPLYTAPSLEYIPLLYGPLYVYGSAVVAFLFGESYASLRFVSMAATLGTQLMIAKLVWRESGSRLAALVAAGLYAGMYGVVGFFFDVARVDSLFVFFTMAMAYYIRGASERGGAAIVYAVLAAAAAVLTKQTALVPVFFLSLWGLAIGGGGGRLTPLLCLGSALLSQIIPALASNGWYFYYLYEMPLAHPLMNANLRLFLENELLARLSLGLVLSLWALIILFRKSQEKRQAFFFLSFFLAMAIASLAPRWKIGGHVNNLMPLAAALAVGCGLMAGLARNQRKWRAGLVVFLLIGCNLQVFYWPATALPSPGALERKQIELKVFRNLEGRIFAPCHPYLPALTAKNGSAFWGGMYDVGLTSGEVKAKLQEEFYQALEGRHFQAVVLPAGFFMQNHFPYSRLAKNYRGLDLSGILGAEDVKKNPLMVYVPRNKEPE